MESTNHYMKLCSESTIEFPPQVDKIEWKNDFEIEHENEISAIKRLNTSSKPTAQAESVKDTSIERQEAVFQLMGLGYELSLVEHALDQIADTSPNNVLLATEWILNNIKKWESQNCKQDEGESAMLKQESWLKKKFYFAETPKLEFSKAIIRCFYPCPIVRKDIQEFPSPSLSSDSTTLSNASSDTARDTNRPKNKNEERINALLHKWYASDTDIIQQRNNLRLRLHKDTWSCLADLEIPLLVQKQNFQIPHYRQYLPLFDDIKEELIIALCRFFYFLPVQKDPKDKNTKSAKESQAEEENLDYTFQPLTKPDQLEQWCLDAVKVING
ncbi:hypothetical protein RFI_35697, partial [Reticulomyxa filosa]